MPKYEVERIEMWCVEKVMTYEVEADDEEMAEEMVGDNPALIPVAEHDRDIYLEDIHGISEVRLV